MDSVGNNNPIYHSMTDKTQTSSLEFDKYTGTYINGNKEESNGCKNKSIDQLYQNDKAVNIIRDQGSDNFDQDFPDAIECGDDGNRGFMIFLGQNRSSELMYFSFFSSLWKPPTKKKYLIKKSILKTKYFLFAPARGELIMIKKSKKGKYSDFGKKVLVFLKKVHFFTFFKKSAQNSILAQIFSAGKKVENRILFFAISWGN